MYKSLKKSAQLDGPNDETLARVSHLYYVLGLTQNEIARRLAITRFKVHRLLVRAREKGMVRIEIDVPFTARFELESALMEAYRLSAAFVFPSDVSDDVSISEVIGIYAANVAAGFIKDGMTVATSWGQTLRALAIAIEPNPANDLSVVSMIGSLSTRSGQDKYEAATVLAERLGAECFYLPGPILCDTVAAKEVINAQPAAQIAMQKSKTADLALLSIGGCEMSSIKDAAFLSDEMYKQAIDAGAIGNFLGRFIGANGASIQHDLNELSVGIDPESIQDIPCRILCAGGSHKVAAMKAVLLRDVATVLVTNDQTARALLK